ncbi:MAG: hypothetical protein E7258_01730 [Lachnospiraceae bacterium]|nr:hypothetical protein [Lachnospiraceae bacterium]
MSGSTIAIIYGIFIAIFLLLLIVLTITLVVNRKKDDEDDFDEEKDGYEYDLFLKDEDAVVNDDFATLDSAVSKMEDALEDEDSIFAEADSAFAKSAPIDSAFADVLDEEEEIDNLDSAFDDVDVGPDSITIDLAMDSAFDAILNAEESEDKNEMPVGDSAFIEEPAATVEDSAFVEEPAATVEDSAFVEEPAAIVEDSAFVEEPAATVEDSAFVEEPATAVEDSAFAEEPVAPMEDSAFVDSAFADSAFSDNSYNSNQVIDEALDQSVKEAVALGAAMTNPSYQESVSHSAGGRHKPRKSFVSPSDDFYWFNKMDVAEKPSYKTAEMYHHHFNVPKDCIEELIMEMYDCALVRTEEIKYIAYGIEPRAVSMKEILTSGNRNYTTQAKLKEPSTQDLVKVYEKWCGYVDKLFDKVEIHADDYTINEIRKLLYEFGRNDVDVLIEGM